MLQAAFRVAATLFAILVGASLAVAAMVTAASQTDVPVVFLGAGIAVFVASIGAITWLLTRRTPAGRRRGIVTGALLLAGVVGTTAVTVPMGDPRLPAEAVDGMRFAELPTGSRLAWVRVPAARGTPARPPVVFVHGGPGASDMAHDLAFFGELTADGHDVILYDQVGTGHSARLEDPRQYTLDRDVADLEALLAALELERPILIGHSYGSTLVAASMARHRDMASSLVFLAPGAIRPGGEAYFGGMRARLTTDQQVRLYTKLLEPRALLGYVVTLVNPGAAEAWIGDAEFDARFDQLYALTSPGLTCDGTQDLPKPHGLGFFTNTMPRRYVDLREPLSRVSVPTLILKPQCDYLPWSFGTDIAESIDGSLLVYVRGAGHSLHVERRDEVLAEIRAFLHGEPLPIEPQAGLEPPADLDGPIGDAG